MADFLLSVGVDVGLSYDQMQKDISDLVTQLNQSPQRVRVGLEIDHSAIERFRTEVANIHNSMGEIGRVTVSPVDTGGLNNTIDGIARLAQSTQGAISTVQTMRAELNSVNAERIQQAIASINGISAEGASALAHSLGEANVRATEVRARLLEAADAEQQLVALQVRGTNEAGHMVNYLMTYNTETGEISRRMVDITARLEDATAAESHRATTVREITDLYRQIHALMRTNTNANNIASYAELTNQAQLLQDALALARTESISIDEALTRLGTSGATAIGGARDAMSAFHLEMEQTGSSGSVSLTTMYNTVAQMQTLLNNNAGYANLGTYTNLQTQVNLLAQAIELASNGGMTLEAALNAVGLNGSTAIHNAREAMSAFKAEMSGATAEEERLTIGTANYRTALERINTLLRQVRANTEKWTAAKTGKSSADYQVYADQARELENLAQRLSTGTITMREFNAEYSRIRSTASGAETSIKAAGEATQTWTQRVGKLTEKFGTWFSITRVIMAAYRAVREMVSAVIDLDTAMTELKKVTNETDATYEKFLVNATKRAKTLGAELADAVSATADFARLGFGIADAEKLADAAIVYKNVGDGIDDIGTASESIIATMQAFSIPAEEVMKIVDKFNEVGNNYAISSKGVGDALLRSAAAMHAANNSLDESIALATAANTIVQDPEKVGTTLKTVSMYLRAAKTEAEEAGESTDGMANSVSELREEILSLTGNRVDIQIDEDTFKSTYQIMKELSEVWSSLTDVTQANITELVGGKRNSNVVSALLENFTVAEEALKTSAESAGSALTENEKVLESIQGKINIMKASFETFAQNFIGGDLVKFFVELATSLLNVSNGVAKFVNALGGLKTVLLAVTSVLLISKGGLIAYKATLLGVAAVEKIIAFFTNLRAGISTIMNIIPNAIVAWKSYAAGVVSANTAMQASIPVIGLLLAAITAVVAGISLFNNKVEENNRQTLDNADAAANLSDEVGNLAIQYVALSTAISDDENSRELLLKVQNDLIESLKLERFEVRNLTEEYGSLSKALVQASKASLEKAEIDLRAGVNTSSDNLMNAINNPLKFRMPTDKGFWLTNPLNFEKDIKDRSTRTLNDARKLQKELDDAEAAFDVLINKGYLNRERSLKTTGTTGEKDRIVSGMFSAGLVFNDIDLSTTEGVVDAYQKLGDMLRLVGDEAGSNNYIYKELYEMYSYLSGAVDRYQENISALNQNLAQQYIIQSSTNAETLESNSEFAHYRKSIIDAAVASGEFQVTTEEIAQAIDDALSSSDQFTRFFENTSKASDSAAKKVSSYTTALSSIQSLDVGMRQLSDIYSDIKDGETFDWSSILNNDDFKNAFGSLGDAYSNFINTISNSPSDLSSCQSAFDKLTEEYIFNSDALNNVTNASRDATVAMLEQMGVANAAQMVDAKLAYQKLYLEEATGRCSNATYTEILRYLDEAEAGSLAQQVLAQLALEKLHVNDNTLSFGTDIDNLVALANTANATTASLERLAKAKLLQTALVAESTRVENYIKEHNITDPRGLSAIRSQERVLESQIEELLNTPLDFEKFDASMFEGVVFDGGTYNSSDTSSNSDKSNTETKESEFEKLYKKHQHLVAMDKESTADFLDWLDKAYKEAYKRGEIELDDYYSYEEEVYEGRRELFKDFINDVNHEISMRESYEGDTKEIIALNQKLMSEIEKEMAKARKQGLTDNDEYIQELQSSWQDCFNYIKDLKDEALEDAKSSIDELVEYRIDMIKQELEDEQDALDKRLDAIKDFYDKQKELLQDQHDEEEYLEEQSEKRKSIADLEAELAMLESDDSAWAQKRRLEIQEELNTANKELDDFESDHALDLALDALDKGYEAEEAKIQAEMDALEEKLNDPKALFNQALADIVANTDGIGHDGTLFYEMIKYNRKHGTGNDNDVIDIWENAYIASTKYKDIFGEGYNGMIIPNATGYKPNTESWDDVVVAVPIDKKSKGYAKGTTAASTGLHELYEEGFEHIFVSADGNRYRLFEGGEQVLSAQATKFLYNFATSGGSLFFDLLSKYSPNSSMGKVSPASSIYEIKSGDIIIEGNADSRTISEIRRVQRNNIDYILKEFTKLSK